MEKCGAFTDGCGKLFHVIKGEKYDHNETTFYVETAEVVKLDALKTAVNGFIDSVKANSEKSSIAVVSFASGANNISSGLLPVKDKADDLKNAVKGLTDAQKQKLAQLFDKISKLDLDVDKLKQQAESIYNKLQDLGLTVDEAQGWLDKIVSFFKKIAETVSSWF